jgi:hypothetical protein
MKDKYGSVYEQGRIGSWNRENRRGQIPDRFDRIT